MVRKEILALVVMVIALLLPAVVHTGGLFLYEARRISAWRAPGGRRTRLLPERRPHAAAGIT